MSKHDLKARQLQVEEIVHPSQQPIEVRELLRYEQAQEYTSGRDIPDIEKVQSLIGENEGSVTVWSPEISYSLDDYVTHMVAGKEYLFRSNFDANTEEPTLLDNTDWQIIGATGNASIDDTNISTATTWSSEKIIPKPLITIDGALYLDGNLSLDGKQILNNYSRFTGVAFNTTITTIWNDGTPLTADRIDDKVYFRNPPSVGGYSVRNFKVEDINPYEFGAIGDAVTDDAQALTDYGNYVLNNLLRGVMLRGRFAVASKVVWVASTKAAKVIVADCIISSKFTAEDEILSILNWDYGVISGKLEIVCNGSTSWASRKNGYGLAITNCARFNFNDVIVTYAKYDGIDVRNGCTGSIVQWLRAAYCGTSGPGATGTRINALSYVNTGGASSVNQRSVVTVDTTLNIPANVSYCDINGNLHLIKGVDAVNKTITVYPWVDSSVGTSVPLPVSVEIYMGGGYKVSGSDSSSLHVVKYDGFVCGIGIQNKSLYPASFGGATLQRCGIAFVIGDDENSANVGGYCGHSYYELNVYDIVQLTTTNVGYDFGTTTALNFAKCVNISPRNAGNAQDGSLLGFKGITIQKDGVLYTGSKELPRSTQRNTLTIGVAPGPSTFYFPRNNTQAINITADSDINRLFGYTSAFIMAHGTGAQGQPTGTYTFTPPATYAINGGVAGAALAISGMKKPTMFYMRIDFSLSAITITRSTFDLASNPEISAPATGTLVTSGSGQTTVNIPHGLGAVPTFTSVNPKSVAARNAGILSWTEDATNIIITLAVPADTGTNNLTFVWEAKL